MAAEGDTLQQKKQEGSEKAEAAAGPAPAPVGSEDQITNAVAFLTHPKVRESTEASKRSFLKSKGLSDADIDEAFRRAGPASASAPATSAPQASTSAAGGGGGPQQPPKPWERPPPAAPPKQESLRWTQVVLGAGVAAGGVYAAKHALQRFAPNFNGFGFLSGGSSNAEPGANGRAEAPSSEADQRVDALVSDLKQQTSELQNSVDSLKQMFLNLEGSVSEYKTAAGNQEEVGELRDELRSLASTINQFASPEKQAYEETLKDELSAIKNILSDINANTPGGGGGVQDTPGEVNSQIGLSSLEGQAHRTMSQLIEAEAAGSSGKPLELPPHVASSYHSPSTPDMATMYAGAGPSSSSSVPAPEAALPASSSKGKGKRAVSAAAPSSSATPVQPPPQQQPVGVKDEPPRPHSYMEILEMLEKNQTPPGIRTDIDDKVKESLDGGLKEVRVSQAPLKPWQRSAGLAGSSSGAVAGEIEEIQDSAADVSQGGAPSTSSGWTPPPVPMSRLSTPQ